MGASTNLVKRLMHRRHLCEERFYKRVEERWWRECLGVARVDERVVERLVFERAKVEISPLGSDGGLICAVHPAQPHRRRRNPSRRARSLVHVAVPGARRLVDRIAWTGHVCARVDRRRTGARRMRPWMGEDGWLAVLLAVGIRAGSRVVSMRVVHGESRSVRMLRREPERLAVREVRGHGHGRGCSRSERKGREVVCLRADGCRREWRFGPRG